MVKIAFFDIDGTLFSHTTGKIPESNIRAIQALRAQNVLIVLATGRHDTEIKKLGIESHIPIDAYITLNGQYCYNDKGVIYANPIHKDDVDYTLAYLEKESFPCMFLESHKVYMNFHNEHVEKVQEAIHSEAPPIESLERVKTHPIYQIIPYFRMNEGEAYLQGLTHSKITRWNVGAVDVIPENGGKHIGIEKVLEYYHIEKEQSIAFGDGENDIEMFDAVGISVAMGNSADPVKAKARYVTDSVDEDGILHYLQDHAMSPSYFLL